MDAIVQFIRNFLCCVKDLGLFSPSFLYDPSFTARFYKFPSPFMSKTTPLEVLISISQLYAAISCTLSGVKLIYSEGVAKLMRLSAVADVFSKLLDESGSVGAKEENTTKTIKQEKEDKDPSKQGPAKQVAKQIISSSLLQEADVAMQNTFSGICVLTIGISFFWLFGNSLHITEAGWIGGLPALIHALTAAELALVPLLYLMLKTASKSLKMSDKMASLNVKYADKKMKELREKESMEVLFNHDNYTTWIDPTWSPFWTKPGMAHSAALDIMAGEKLLVKESEKIEKQISDKLKTENVILLDHDQSQALAAAAHTHRMEGYREYLYFVLNFIAFYGYMLGVLTYYFDDEKDQHYIVQQLKLGYTNMEADWGGNFAGDLMWTIEPIVIFASPFVMKRCVNRVSVKKMKKD